MKIEPAWLSLINITHAHALRERRRRKLDRRKSAIAFFLDSSLFWFAFTPSQMRALSVQLETQTMRYFACIKWVKTFKFSTWRRLQISREEQKVFARISQLSRFCLLWSGKSCEIWHHSNPRIVRICKSVQCIMHMWSLDHPLKTGSGFAASDHHKMFNSNSSSSVYNNICFHLRFRAKTDFLLHVKNNWLIIKLRPHFDSTQIEGIIDYFTPQNDYLLLWCEVFAELR